MIQILWTIMIFSKMDVKEITQNVHANLIWRNAWYVAGYISVMAYILVSRGAAMQVASYWLLCAIYLVELVCINMFIVFMRRLLPL